MQYPLNKLYLAKWPSTPHRPWHRNYITGCVCQLVEYWMNSVFHWLAEFKDSQLPKIKTYVFTCPWRKICKVEAVRLSLFTFQSLLNNSLCYVCASRILNSNFNYVWTKYQFFTKLLQILHANKNRYFKILDQITASTL